MSLWRILLPSDRANAPLLDALQHEVVAGLPAHLGQVVPAALDPHPYHVRREVVVGAADVAGGEEPGAHAVEVRRHLEVLELADALGREAAGHGDLDLVAVLRGQLRVVAGELPGLPLPVD